MSTRRWRRLAERAAAPPPEDFTRCELCALPVDDAHRHLLDLPTKELRCVCVACALLFDRAEAGGGHYRALPDRSVALSSFTTDEATWTALGVPVGLAFFVVDDAGEVTAAYPNPLGLVRSAVERAPWASLVRANPPAAGLRPEVEALLVDRRADRGRAWVVPLDACYRLSAVVRQWWKGFTGGTEVWREVDRFCAGLVESPGRHSAPWDNVEVLR